MCAMREVKDTGRWRITRWDGRTDDNHYLHSEEWIYGVHKEVCVTTRKYVWWGKLQHTYHWVLVEKALSMRTAEQHLAKHTNPPKVKQQELMKEVML